MRTASVLVFTLFIASAQPRMSAPVAGYVFDGNARAIRAVVGVPGAASAGDRLPLNDSLSAAYLHPSRALAVGIGKNGSASAATWDDPLHPQQSSITPRFGVPARIVFAAGADKALLLSAAGIELWAGLGGGSTAPVWAYTAEALGGIPLNGALSPDGALAAVVLDTAVVVEVSDGGVRAAGQGRSAIYVDGPADLFILGSDGALSRSGTAITAGLDPDAELAVMNGFGGVIALSNQKGTLSLIGTTGQLTSLDCGCKPARSQPLSTPGILYFEDAERGAFLLDVTGATPRVVSLTGIDGRGNQ